MILIDTNVLYYLAQIEDNTKINRKKLESFLLKEDVCISPITIFEILNNKQHKKEYSFIIEIVSRKCRTISFVTTSYFSCFCPSDLLIDLENKSFELQKEIGTKLSSFVIEYYCYFYSNLIAETVLAYFLVFWFIDDTLNDEKASSSFFQAWHDDLFYKIFSFIKNALLSLVKNESFTEKARKQIFKRLINVVLCYFAPVIKDAIGKLDKGIFSCSQLFLSMKARLKSINIVALYTNKKNKARGFPTFFQYISSNNQLEKAKVNQVIDRIVDSIKSDVPLFNPIVDSLFKKYLKLFLINGGKSTDNDLLDASLFDYVPLNSKNPQINGLITFDSKFYNFVRQCNDLNAKVYFNEFLAGKF